MSTPIIRIKDLHHTYMSGTPLSHTSLRGVDLYVVENEITAVVGPTGSGKSTLLQHMNGLIRPQRGEVWVAGHDLSDRQTDLQKIRHMVGLVFQRPGDQLFEQYVGDDVAYGPRMMGMARSDLRDRVQWAMSQAGLDFELYRDRLTATLSGGERRRAGLASVLAMRPKVLLLDEPTAGLDPAMHTDLISRLQQLHQQGTTIVFVTHNMDDVALLAHRVYVLHKGRVTLNGRTREIFRQQGHLFEIGLDIPVITSIASTLYRRGLDIPPDILTLEEAALAIARALNVKKGADERV